MKNVYSEIWKELEKKFELPTRARDIISMDFNDFAQKIDKEEVSFVNQITRSLINGDIYILKNAFDKKFFDDLKINCYSHFKGQPSSFHKMTEGCPDFHRIIDLETGKKYSFRGCKHSFYFYNWNNDPLSLFETTYKRWRKIKKLMGYTQDIFENNTPKDGPIDRIQVVRYPSKYGYLEPHSDPYKYQKFFISGYMSKKGEDYVDGGFYALNLKDEIIDVEKLIDVGDIGIGFATIVHGVAPANRHKDPNWEDINDGRWFYSLYTNESDEIKNRHTAHAAAKDEVKIDNDLLFPPQN